eukprot:403335002
MCFQQIAYNGCLLNPLTPPCQSKFFSQLSCFSGFTMLLVCEPLAILPYIMRSIRLRTIMKAQQYFVLHQEKPKKSIKWISEKYLIRIIVIWVGLLVTICLVFYFMHFASIQVIVIAPSYNVSVCYVDNMSSVITSQSIHDNVETHTNLSITWILFVTYLECFFFMFAIYTIRNISKVFSIQREIITVFLVWMSMSFLGLGIFIFSTDSKSWQISSIILVLRNLCICLISTIPPIRETFQHEKKCAIGGILDLSKSNNDATSLFDNSLKPLMMSQLGAMNMSIINNDALTYEYFNKFLEMQYQDFIEIQRCYALFGDINIFNRKIYKYQNKLEIAGKLQDSKSNGQDLKLSCVPHKIILAFTPKINNVIGLKNKLDGIIGVSQNNENNNQDEDDDEYDSDENVPQFVKIEEDSDDEDPFDGEPKGMDLNRLIRDKTLTNNNISQPFNASDDTNQQQHLSKTYNSPNKAFFVNNNQHLSISDFDEIVNESLFIELYAWVQQQLLPIFESFKRNRQFSEMEDLRRFQKMLREVLEDAGLVEGNF